MNHVTIADIRETSRRCTGITKIDREAAYESLRFTLPSDSRLDVVECAAQYLAAFVSYSPCIVDNEVVACHAVAFFLKRNRHRLDPEHEALVDVVDMMAEGKRSVIDALKVLRSIVVSRSS